LAGPVATRTDACIDGSDVADLGLDVGLVSSPNNQLMLYKPPGESTPKGIFKISILFLCESSKIFS
jgi:hypothetical protein